MGDNNGGSGETSSQGPAKRSWNIGCLVSLLAAILMLVSLAQPMLRGVVRASRDGASRGNLGAIRAALEKYASDHNGARPAALDELASGGKYLDHIPDALTQPYHSPSSSVMPGAVPSDTGGWLYDAAAQARHLRVNCTHTDHRGKNWNSY